MTGQSRPFLGPALGVGATLFLGGTIFAADRLGVWVWVVVGTSALAIIGLTAGLAPVRRAVRAGLGVVTASMTQWWDSIGPEWHPTEPQEPAPLIADAPREPRGPVHEAEGLLVSLLAEGPVKSIDIYKVALEDGISRRTLQRAKTRLGVTVKRITHGNGGQGYWTWQLSNGTAAPPQANEHS